jgi:hypothetical protein
VPILKAHLSPSIASSGATAAGRKAGLIAATDFNHFEIMKALANLWVAYGKGVLHQIQAKKIADFRRLFRVLL